MSCRDIKRVQMTSRLCETREFTLCSEDSYGRAPFHLPRTIYCHRIADATQSRAFVIFCFLQMFVTSFFKPFSWLIPELTETLDYSACFMWIKWRHDMKMVAKLEVLLFSNGNSNNIEILSTKSIRCQTLKVQPGAVLSLIKTD